MAPERPNFDWQNPDKWVVYPRRVVFDEHERTVKGDDGQDRVVKVTREDLERAAAHNNERDRAGCPGALTIGHTDPTQPSEEKQPVELVGYARNFGVEWSPELQRYVAVCDYYVMRNKDAKAREFPRTSVEFWRNRKLFDPIALLKRTPERPVPVWVYVMRGQEEVIRYSMGDGTMADAVNTIDPNDPAAQPDANADQEYARMKGHVERYCAENFPHLRKMHDEYASQHAMAPAPGTTNTEPPIADTRPGNPDQMRAGASSGEIPVQYRQMIDAQNKRIAQLEKDKRTAEAREIVSGLAREYEIKNEQRLVERFAAADANGRKELLAEVRENYRERQDPTLGWMPLPEGTRAKSGPMTAEQKDAAISYMADQQAKGKSVSWDEAMQYAMK